MRWRVFTGSRCTPFRGNPGTRTTSQAGNGHCEIDLTVWNHRRAIASGWGERTMRITACGTVRRLSIVFVLVPSIMWAVPPEASGVLGQQGSAAPQPSPQSFGNPAPIQPSDPLPDSPGTLHTQTSGETTASAEQQLLAQQSQSGTQAPVGTAAAEAASPVGVMASKPAGAAIAPAKQRRVRMLLIKVGAVVGAGVAIGAVAALSSGSPSRPPGAH